MSPEELETRIKNGEYTVVKKLNAREIEEIEALQAQVFAAEKAFNTAFNFYMNRLSTNKLQVDDFYSRMTGDSILSTKATTYSIANVEGFATVIKLERD
jgi:hypothetical protein